MRIAEIAPPWFTIPPSGYGGIESVVHTLTGALVQRGHDVTLFAPGGSETTARLVTPIERPASLADPNADGAEADYVRRVYRRAASFDLIHDHTNAGPALVARASASGMRLPPVVHTLHGPWTAESRLRYRQMNGHVHLVAISDAQRAANRAVPYAGRVHNGVDVRRFPFERAKRPYLAFVGRSCREKGPDRAIRVARLAGLPIQMMVKRHEPAERAYWERFVIPLLGDDVRVIPSEAGPARTMEMLGGARATLFPVAWQEPFGMVMIESMACGTPVLASPMGAVPEVITDGVTGFLCSSIEDMAAATHRSADLDPADCRRHVADRFSEQTLVDGYERVFRSVLAGEGSLDDEPGSRSPDVAGVPASA